MAKTILLIDDSDFILESTSTLLEFAGYKTVTADNGQTGIEKAKEINPDLIICDVSMPGISGFDVIVAIREDPATRQIPFIFLTAFTEKQKMREGIEKGADDYLTKPFTKKELIAAVETQWKKDQRIVEKIQGEVESVGKNLNYALPHEFRTPISLLKGCVNELKNNIDVLDKTDILAECDQMIDITNRLERIIDNFLMFTTLENNSKSPSIITEMRKAKTDEPIITINDLVESIGIKYERTADIEIKETVFDISIAMVSELFHRLINELIDNAFKFSQKGEKIIINTAIVNGFYSVSILDEGIGITSEQLKSIATAFVQFDRDKNEQQGVGLGLTIARKIVELHGGKFEITNEHDAGLKGILVKFTIPLAK
ncbi:MAG: response regulator [Bacteroidetes bacterium]|nr:response regulator [Bacteroidota bacterium]